jgi:hypothetical protein
MFERVVLEPTPGTDDGLPDDDFDGVFERQLAWLDTLPSSPRVGRRIARRAWLTGRRPPRSASVSRQGGWRWSSTTAPPTWPG